MGGSEVVCTFIQLNDIKSHRCCWYLPPIYPLCLSDIFYKACAPPINYKSLSFKKIYNSKHSLGSLCWPLDNKMTFISENKEKCLEREPKKQLRIIWDVLLIKTKQPLTVTIYNNQNIKICIALEHISIQLIWQKNFKRKNLSQNNFLLL